MAEETTNYEFNCGMFFPREYCGCYLCDSPKQECIENYEREKQRMFAEMGTNLDKKLLKQSRDGFKIFMETL